MFGERNRICVRLPFVVLTVLTIFTSEPSFGEGVGLAAATNFSHPGVTGADRVAGLGVTDVRDGMRWSDVERVPGRYGFDLPRTRYPDALAREGVALSVTVNWGNALYDGGDTPQSPEALAAQARYVAALVERFPGIGTIEVGNEFNGANFVTGPLKKADARARAAAHVAILKAIDAAVGDEVRLLGGATHSIPLAYLSAVLDGGGAEHMDALALHPYTTAPEEFPAQVALLRRHPAARELPLEITEFGDEDPARAPGTLVRWLAVMAVNGVERAVWYPLTDRGDGLAPLFDAAGAPTPAGRAYRFAAARLAGRPAQDVSPDRHTVAVRFGDDTLVLWGEPRAVDLGAGVAAFGPEGEALSGPIRLAPDRPVVLVKPAIALGTDVTLGPDPILADSFWDFAYPNADGTAPAGPLARFVRLGGRDIALQTMPGQERGSVPWTPYLGGAELFPLRLSATAALPRGGRRPADIVTRFVAPADGEVDASAVFLPSRRTTDGVAVSLVHNDAVVARAAGRERIELAQRLLLKAGDRVDVVLGANGSNEGDATAYRIRFAAPGSAPATLR